MPALILSACFPVIVFLIIIYKKDTEKEPPKLLVKCFLVGCISTIPIIFIELFVSKFNFFLSPFWYSFYEAFVVAALVEEGVKYFFLYRLIWNSKEFDQYFDGIVYAVFVSLGFALIENIFYIIDNGFGTAIMRGILSVPGHGLFGVMMGYFFALAKFSPNKKGFLFLSLFIPLLFHGFYDFLLFYMGENENTLLIILLFIGFIALIICLWRFGIKYIKSHYSKDINQNNMNSVMGTEYEGKERR